MFSFFGLVLKTFKEISGMRSSLVVLFLMVCELLADMPLFQLEPERFITLISSGSTFCCTKFWGFFSFKIKNKYKKRIYTATCNWCMKSYFKIHITDFLNISLLAPLKNI